MTLKSNKICITIKNKQSILHNGYCLQFLAESIYLHKHNITINRLLCGGYRRLGSVPIASPSSVNPIGSNGKVFKRYFQNMYNVFIGKDYVGCAKTEVEAKTILNFVIPNIKNFGDRFNKDLEQVILNGYDKGNTLILTKRYS